MNPIIFGKNNTERIVNIEVVDDVAQLSILNEDLSVSIKEVPNKYWMLASEPLQKFVRLKGNLPYCYGMQFSDKQKWYQARNQLKNKDTFFIRNDKESLMVKDGYTYFKGMSLLDIPILSFDLETTTLKLGDDSKILLISNTFRRGSQIVRKLFAYDEYESQGVMLEDWARWVREMNPIILCGHNINGFDLPYILHVAEMEQITVNLGTDRSPLKQSDYESKYRIDGSKDLHYKKHSIFGREIIDTLHLAYKYDATEKKYVTYNLKVIIAQEGIEKPGRTFYDASQIRFNYKIPEEWIKIKEYCKDDSDDGLALVDRMAPPYFFMCQNIPKSFQALIESASGSQLNAMMVRSYLQEAHSLPRMSETQGFTGAISDGWPGIYKNVWKIDVTSLYPSIMLQYNIYDADKDPKNHLLSILTDLRNGRLTNKKLYKETGDPKYKHLDNSQKILLNSLYGFLGSSVLFNSPRNAALVTHHGREIIKKTVLWATGKEYVPTKVEEKEAEE